jgi:hypothetical protein
VYKLLSVILIAIALGTGCAFYQKADERICANCGEPITGKFLEVEGAYFHPGHFTCAYCKNPIEEETYVPEDGKQYHTSCYAGRIIVCAHCGDPDKEETFVTYKGKTYHSSCAREQVVTCAYCEEPTEEDTFVDYEGKDYHRSCFRKYIVPCAFCGNQIRDETYTTSKGKKYHSSCYEEFVALRCTLCREKIEGTYIAGYWGDTYHPSHKTDSPSCDFCGRFLRTPLEGGAVRYDDGRYLCGSCHASAVTTEKQVKDLAFEVSERLRRFGIDVDVDKISIQVVGAEKMGQINYYSQHKLTGSTTCREVVEAPGRTTYEYIQVYILYGMPRVQMTAVIAHELMHVWQLLNGRLKIYQTLAEGSCQYASYLVLEEIPGGMSEYVIHTITEDKDKVYSEGFRRVSRYVEANGISSWLTLLKNNDPLPKY